MKKIIVAGAGHGGLSAAFSLAENGFDVTVYEKGEREQLGHDWHDFIDYSAFDGSDIERPEEELIISRVPSGFENPSSTVKLVLPKDSESDGFMIDRKLLIRYLTDKCEEAGVKLCFGCDIKGAVFESLRVTGISYEKNGELITEKGDMVIDACGMHSPVRKSLPPCFGIRQRFEAKETFYVYRVYLENLTGEIAQPQYLISLFHGGKPGIDWMLITKESVDILVGKFGTAGELTQEEIDRAIEAYREKYSFIGKRVLRGGVCGEIPLSRMLPLIVADGYAAAGDSAGMTIPLNGSGIVLSMKAGKILADKIISCEENPFSVENLWKYEYEYFQSLGKDLVIIDILKNFFTFCDKRDVDYILEKKILTEEQLDFHNGISLSPKHIMHIIAVAMPLIGLLPTLVGNLKSVPLIDTVAKAMPVEYDKKAVEDWIEKYSRL